MYSSLALVFDIEKGDHLPTHISYRIRMDTDRVDSTSKNKVLDRSVQSSFYAYPFQYMLVTSQGFSD